MGIFFKTRREGSKTEDFIKRIQQLHIEEILRKYGEIGVQALRSATPIDSGLTASSWGYEIEKHGDTWSIYWTNSNINEGVNIAVILQYGHGTGTGGYVSGQDYINPAMAPIFEQIANDAWKEVTS